MRTLLALVVVLAVSLVSSAARAQPPQPTAPLSPQQPAPPPPLTPSALRSALAASPAEAEVARLREKVEAWFGKDALPAGNAAKTDGLEAAFAVKVPGAQKAQLISVEGNFRLALQPLGGDGLFVGTTTLSDGTAMRFAYEVDGKRLGGGQLEAYAVHPDSVPQPAVPRGKVLPQKKWKSHVFEGTERDWWIYVPAQYRANQPAALMVFQDGGGYVKFVPAVFDNLIAKGDMPVTVGVFLDPGVFAGGRKNRSFEYDTLSDQYARFLIEEIVPEVEKTAKLRKGPEWRAVAGLSSGGICAFTVAWQRPEQFGKVLSWIGSFTNIASGKTNQEGGHNYPALIRKVPKKPIRVFLQDGENDLDNNHGSWPLANKAMAKSLTYAGYDYRIVWGQGFHSNAQGRAILPDSLRWLWRDHKPTPTPPPAARVSTAR